MPLTDAQRRAREKWLTKIDEIKFRVPKEKKTIIQEHAALRGESINAFLNRAVDETIRRDQDDNR